MAEHDGASRLMRDEMSRLVRVALAARKRKGIRLGRPSRISLQVLAKAADLRARGFTLQAIANELNAVGAMTASGRVGCWGTSSVQSALVTERLNREANARLPEESR
jgi:hypothetical protein